MADYVHAQIVEVADFFKQRAQGGVAGFQHIFVEIQGFVFLVRSGLYLFGFVGQPFAQAGSERPWIFQKVAKPSRLIRCGTAPVAASC